MKKKIKDLTIKEFNKFCDKQNENCIDCPFYGIEFEEGEGGCDLISYIYQRDKLLTQFNKYPLKQEIEVDLSEEED